MKILHVNSYYNGSEFYKNFYDEQVTRGLDIDVFVPVSSSYKQKETNFQFGNYTHLSINHMKYDRFFYRHKHRKIFKDIKEKYEFNKFSLIHAHSLFSNGLIALKLKKEFKLPYIVAVRNTDVNVFFAKMPHLRKIGIKILAESDGIIFLSEPYKEIVLEKYIPDSLKAEFEKKIKILPNGIDNYWFENQNTFKKTPANENLKILYVGTIDQNKNIITTIKAIKKLRDLGYKVKFTIVGRVKDELLFEQINNNSFVEYLPPMTKESLIEVYREHEIFVMPSKKETFGLVYAEAMSQGLPVIYTKDQGFDKQFEEGQVGFHVDSTDSNQLVTAIKKILEKYEIISLNCSTLATKFKWNQITNEYNKLYKEVTKSLN